MRVHGWLRVWLLQTPGAATLRSGGRVRGGALLLATRAPGWCTPCETSVCAAGAFVHTDDLQWLHNNGSLSAASFWDAAIETSQPEKTIEEKTIELTAEEEEQVSISRRPNDVDHVLSCCKTG
jgi:hypothetical protein